MILSDSVQVIVERSVTCSELSFFIYPIFRAKMGIYGYTFKGSRGVCMGYPSVFRY